MIIELGVFMLKKTQDFAYGRQVLYHRLTPLSLTLSLQYVIFLLSKYFHCLSITPFLKSNSYDLLFYALKLLYILFSHMLAYLL